MNSPSTEDRPANSVPVRRFNPWPIALISYFSVAIVGVITFIVFASRQGMELVRPDYYNDEVRYQEQLDRLNRTLPIRDQVAIAFDPTNASVVIRFTGNSGAGMIAATGQAVAGSVQLYRPSDSGLDRAMPLHLGADGVQRIATDGMRTGLWKIRLRWSVAGQEFFVDQPVVIGLRLG